MYFALPPTLVNFIVLNSQVLLCFLYCTISSSDVIIIFKNIHFIIIIETRYGRQRNEIRKGSIFTNAHAHMTIYTGGAGGVNTNYKR